MAQWREPALVTATTARELSYERGEEKGNLHAQEVMTILVKETHASTSQTLSHSHFINLLHPYPYIQVSFTGIVINA